MQSRLILTHALTSLHPGTGQGVGVIDLPVARETATGIPYLPGSSLKGVLRDRCDDPATRSAVFGPEPGSMANEDMRAGSAIFSDQRLLLLPVRSLAGTFAWVTSPFVLQRFRRDCQNIGIKLPNEMTPTGATELLKAYVPHGSALGVTVPGQNNQPRSMIFLEDLDLQQHSHAAAEEWLKHLRTYVFWQNQEWQDLFTQRFCIVHDDVFSFLLDTATEISARNKLDDNKTSENLWYIETLPAETVLYGIVTAQQVGDGKSPDDVLTEVRKLVRRPMQLGGNSSVGRGMCRLQLVAPAAAKTS